MTLDPTIWGPHYWFFLMTIAVSYPKKANSVLKKKYYDFIMNLPLFIPDDKIGNKFSTLLDKYPVEPYLDSRESFIKWVHFIHNKINNILGKDDIPYMDAINIYYSEYKPKELIYKEQIKQKKLFYYSALLIVLICIAIFLYKK